MEIVFKKEYQPPNLLFKNNFLFLKIEKQFFSYVDKHALNATICLGHYIHKKTPEAIQADQQRQATLKFVGE